MNLDLDNGVATQQLIVDIRPEPATASKKKNHKSLLFTDYWKKSESSGESTGSRNVISTHRKKSGIVEKMQKKMATEKNRPLVLEENQQNTPKVHNITITSPSLNSRKVIKSSTKFVSAPMANVIEPNNHSNSFNEYFDQTNPFKLVDVSVNQN